MGRATQGIAMALGFGSSHKAGISELFIMTKGGLLLRHYSDSLRTDVDRDALGGMLVAVQQFVQQTLASKSGALNEVKDGAHSIFFFRGVHTVAAAGANEGDAETPQFHGLEALQQLGDRCPSTVASSTA